VVPAAAPGEVRMNRDPFTLPDFAIAAALVLTIALLCFG
jgi:hypothetical protein